MSDQPVKRNFQTLVDVFVSAGAAVVIFAAWAKLVHQPYANTLLTIGMWTETSIFVVYAILGWVKPDPSLLSHKTVPAVSEVAASKVSDTPLDSLNDMLNKAEITPANLKKLGENFQKLDTTVSQLGDVGDVVKSTGDFSMKTKEANTALGMMKEAFLNSANTMSNFNSAADSARGFQDQVQVLTKNLGSLNTIYELELNESNNHLKALNSFYGKVAKASEAMVETAEDAQKAKDQISTLANNLGRLNQVYGNMLTAMQPLK